MEKLVIVGTISSVSRKIERELKKLIAAFIDFEVVQIFLVESDSNDNTVQVLNRLKPLIPSLETVSLGNLRDHIPDRITRIRHCRNIYVEYIRNLLNVSHLDYVVVADLDGMNSKINVTSVRSCFVRSDWSVVLANQPGGYYDLLALRHGTWCPGDVMTELRNKQIGVSRVKLHKLNLVGRIRRRLEFDHIRNNVIYSRMKVLNPYAEWVEVESGFGGLGIYRAELFASFDYSSWVQDHESEHVALSRKIRDHGGKIFINPSFINNRWNMYNVNRYFVIRQLRQLVWDLKYRLKLN